MKTRWRATLASHGRVLAICALVQATLGWVATQTYLVERNNLAANGNWVVSKTRLDKGLMGAYSFLSGRQSLAGGGLHLDAWHGFQEVVTARPIAEPRSVELDAVLSPGAWLVVSVNRGGEAPYTALRLSRHWQRPSAFLEVDEDGRFHGRSPVAPDAVPGHGPFRLRLDLAADQVTASVDGREVGTVPFTPLPVQAIGLRGGMRPVAVDNIEIVGAAGDGLSETFSGPAGRQALAAAVGGALVLLNLGLFVVLSRFLPVQGRKLSFAFLTANLTLLVCAGLVFAFVRVRVGWYPGQRELLAESEAFYRKGEQDRVVDDLLERFAGFDGPKARRILFVGSSQTWGAGARRDGDTFVRQLEDLLNEPYRRPRFICLNLGVSSAKARDLLPLVRAIVPQVKPRLVVINLSSNDRASRGFSDAMRRIVDRVQAAGGQPVLVLEANASMAVDDGLEARHAELRALAAELDLPLVDLHGHLQPLEDSGFLWWDKVHLTTYGQRLAAEELHRELLPLLGDEERPRPERAGERRGEARPAQKSRPREEGRPVESDSVAADGVRD